MIVFVHLLNDSSGSPRVLMSTITTLVKDGEQAMLYLGSDGNGCLSHCGIPITRYWYKRTSYRVTTLFTYLFSQLVLFLKLFRDCSISPQAIIYVNTLLPFGAALYGKLTGRKVIYHIHEISITPAPLKYFLTGVARLTSSLNIYVSDTHMLAMPITGAPARRIYNALDPKFIARAGASDYTPQRNGVFRILMIASLRNYKGIPELLKLAEQLKDRSSVEFELLVNDEIDDVHRFFASKVLPGNITVYPRTEDTTPFYERASLVMNLSRVDQWVETFGMTILEAMAYGIPVIAPPVGGPVEIIKNELHGYLVDSRDEMSLVRAVLRMLDNPELCRSLSANCRCQAKRFSQEQFANELQDMLKLIEIK